MRLNGPENAMSARWHQDSVSVSIFDSTDLDRFLVPSTSNCVRWKPDVTDLSSAVLLWITIFSSAPCFHGDMVDVGVRGVGWGELLPLLLSPWRRWRCRDVINTKNRMLVMVVCWRTLDLNNFFAYISYSTSFSYSFN